MRKRTTKKNTQPHDNQSLGPYAPPPEVHLRRMRVDDALDKLRIYLEDAQVAGLAHVWVIHGKGTGVLKAAVMEALASNPLVVSYRMAEPSQGGGGVTMVDLVP